MNLRWITNPLLQVMSYQSYDGTVRAEITFNDHLTIGFSSKIWISDLCISESNAQDLSYILNSVAQVVKVHLPKTGDHNPDA